MRTILVVDDEKEMRKKIKHRLKKEGFKVFEAPDALEVTNIIMRERLDLILLDIDMPEINGPDIFEIIADYPHKPFVLVCSVYPISEQKFKIRKADDYFNKSKGVEALTKKVNQVLGLQQ